MNPAAALDQHREEIVRLARENRVQNLRVFGSVGRGEASAESDLDLLVDLERGGSLFDLIGLKQQLEDLLGCRVDVLTERSLSPHLRARILQESICL